MIVIAALLLAGFVTQSDFVLVDRPDPITQKRQLGLVASSDDGTLVVGCSSTGNHELFVRFSPKGYYGPGSKQLLWQPNAVYRFGNEVADSDLWTFNSDYIELGDIVGANTAKAQFLDRLARNNVLYIRYEARYGETRTASFLYNVSAEQLSYVVRTCDPKRVQEALRKMGSKIETNPH